MVMFNTHQCNPNKEHCHINIEHIAYSRVAPTMKSILPGTRINYTELFMLVQFLVMILVIYVFTTCLFSTFLSVLMFFWVFF